MRKAGCFGMFSRYKPRTHLIELMRQICGTQRVASTIVCQDSPVCSLEGALNMAFVCDPILLSASRAGHVSRMKPFHRRAYMACYGLGASSMLHRIILTCNYCCILSECRLLTV